MNNSEHEKRNDLHGIIPPIITPLLEDETLDRDNFEKLLDFDIERGIHGVFVMGSSGECMNVTRQVWRDTIRVALDTVKDRIPVICGVIDSCTTKVIENIKEAEQLGARIVCTTPAFYLKNTCQDEIVRHFEKICRSTSLDVVVYNIPPMTHVNILPETAARLSVIDNVVAYKDSCNDWEQLQRNLYLLKESGIRLFNGAEEMCGVSLLAGYDGCVPGLAGFFPRIFVDMYDAAVQKDVRRVYELQKSAWNLRKSLFVGKSWLSAMKYIARKIGMGTGVVSSPVQPLTDEEKWKIDAIIEKYM